MDYRRLYRSTFKYVVALAASVSAIICTFLTELTPTDAVWKAVAGTVSGFITACTGSGVLLAPWVSAYPCIISRGWIVVLTILTLGMGCFGGFWVRNVPLLTAVNILQNTRLGMIPLLFRRAWQIHSRSAFMIGVLCIAVLQPVYQSLQVVDLVLHVKTAWVAAALQMATMLIGFSVLTWMHRRSHMTRDAGYVSMLALASLYLPVGLFVLSRVLGDNLPGWAFLIAWSALMFIASTVWVAAVERSVDGAHRMVFVFPLQFADDIFFTLVLSRMAFPSIGFFISLVGFMIRDVLRDVGVVGTCMKRHATFHVKAAQLTQTCCLGMQNLVSELSAGLCLVCMASTSIVMDYMNVGTRYFLHREKFTSVLQGSIVCVVAEVIVHGVVHRWLLHRVRNLQAQYALYTAPRVVHVTAEVPRVTTVISEGRSVISGTVLDPQWDLTDEMYQHFHCNGVYLTTVVCYVTVSTLWLIKASQTTVA